MKQCYTIPCFRNLQRLNYVKEIFTSLRYIYFLSLLTIAQLVLVAFDCAAQKTINPEKIVGSWIVKEANIKMLVVVDDTLQLTKENCFWADHLTKGAPLEIDKSGNISYSAFGKPAKSKVKVEDNRLVFMFFDGIGKEKGVPVAGTYNFTTYDVQISGSKMTLSREDGMVAERYIFERN